MRHCLFIILFILILWNIRLDNEFPEERVKSSLDGKMYIVKKNYTDSGYASDMLARLNNFNMVLIEHLRKKYMGTDREDNISFLSKNYNIGTIQEHTPRTTINTSYVLNKGDEIKICLRNQNSGKIHEFDTILFVNLHELSHLMDLNYGHTHSFWKGFKFLLHEAHELGIYNPVDYSKTPIKYCGIMITSNPFYKKI